MAAREENILNVPISETLEGMHVLCDTGDTGKPYRVAASLFIAEATQAAKDAVANLDPKDVILKGFTALTAGKPAITANTTLLAAIQSLYAMVGSGKVKIVSDGADQTGMVSWNGTSASGFVINVNEAAIYTRSQWTQASPDSVTDANWIAAVKTGGTKTPFAAAAQNPNMGDLPTNSSLKFVDNKTTILGMLKMLTAAANVGRLRIVSGNPATGASGKPELAFIVNIVQGTNAETAGTNGLQIFHLTNDFLRVIPSSSIGMAWPTLQTLTDEDVIKKLNSTASGDWGGLGMKLPWTGGSVKPIKVEDFAVINEIWPAGLTPGTTVLFYAEGEMNSVPSEAADTAYVGQVILNADFATSGMATVVAYGNKAGRMYHAQLDFNGQSIDWFPSPVGTLTLTTFANLTANASVSNMKIGEMLGFYSSNGGSTSGPGISPLFGYIQKTSPMLVNIFAYTVDGKKSWLGYSAGAVVDWTPVGGASGGGGEQTVIWINANQNVFDVGLYPFTKLGEIFPIFIDASATNNPSKVGHPCAGTVQCVGYQGPGSWEAVFIVGSVDEDQIPSVDYYKARLSYIMGSSAWIELTTGSSGVKKLPGLSTELNETDAATTYKSDEFTNLPVGTTLMLCFAVEDADGRFAPSGRVVIYYDLPPLSSNWMTIAGFYDNANGENGYINIRRLGTNNFFIQCVGSLVDGYPGLQIYLEHVFVLG